MLAQTMLPRRVALAPRHATTPELAAVAALISEEESAVSDAPLFRPEAVGALLLGLLLSPKEPKEERH
ncbi:hypothetical protein [Kitasatospora sp. McL0602]|uniref:hypothetical protein n=1 Tax=Kitasatospora sp. McL0602 TaxID=3439530 RepID=UPI003F892149